MRLIEYVVSDLNGFTPSMLLIDVADISFIKKHSDVLSVLNTKQGVNLYLVGNSQQLMNRWIYALIKKHGFYDDKILRPSLYFSYDLKNLQVDSVHLDGLQIAAMSVALNVDKEVEGLSSIGDDIGKYKKIINEYYLGVEK